MCFVGFCTVLLAVGTLEIDGVVCAWELRIMCGKRLGDRGLCTEEGHRGMHQEEGSERDTYSYTNSDDAFHPRKLKLPGSSNFSLDGYLS